jgi:hypothetical protein
VGWWRCLVAAGVLAAILVAGGLKPEPLMSSSVPLDLLYFISLVSQAGRHYKGVPFHQDTQLTPQFT